MRHDSRDFHPTGSDLESLLLVGVLLWLALAALRWLLRHPRMIPLVALVLYLIARSPR